MLNLRVRKISWIRLLNKFEIFVEKLAFQAHKKSLYLKCWLLGYTSPTGIVLCDFLVAKDAIANRQNFNWSLEQAACCFWWSVE